MHFLMGNVSQIDLQIRAKARIAGNAYFNGTMQVCSRIDEPFPDNRTINIIN